ncbi:hypothetical protein V6N13_010943 [Hibiscus sabdariffa]|uniref:Uncharacterized protein n=1 Tax=Hibiscus sabdariffa TaxID=183260 RepID=A0ABR2SAT7_9ROSI
METLLSIDPVHRRSAAFSLKSEFFTTQPLACDPSSLPKYSPRKEIDAKLRDEEARSCVPDCMPLNPLENFPETLNEIEIQGEELR